VDVIERDNAEKIQDRRDAGALHHIIARGIECRTIFQDTTDKRKVLDRLGGIFEDTDTYCYAWALIPQSFSPAVKNKQMN